jgi:hypothetical protein
MNPPLPRTGAGKVQYGKGSKATPAAPSKTKRRLTVAGSLLLLLLIAWFAWPNSQVDKVRKMQQELFATPRDQLTPEERKEKFDELRAEREKLSPEERNQLRQEKGKQFQQKMNEYASKYLAMSPEERQQMIDDQISRQQAVQQKRAQAGSNGGGGPGGGNGGNGPPGGAGGPGGPGAGGPGGPRGPQTPEERDARRREALINMTPMARAGMDQMRLDMATRRVELGLPATTGRGLGFGPGPRGPGARAIP